MSKLLLWGGVGYCTWLLVHSLWSGFWLVYSLKSHYPIVHYNGPAQPSEVEIKKYRPPSWVGLQQISKVAVSAIIVSEDWAFYQHKGYDSKQIAEAFKKDLLEGKFARGASTITQQVVKNVFLEKDKSISRKLKELFLAVLLEKVITKSRILEVYLNIAEWGEGIYGLNAASRYYFQKSPSSLTPKEGAFLAMLLPSPKRYSQSFQKKKLTEYAQETVDTILEKMVQAGYLTDSQLNQERGRPLSFEEKNHF